MVKDKRIELKGRSFIATVEYFRDTPARDRDIPIQEHFDSLHEAQGSLACFPQDVWEGLSGAQSRDTVSAGT